MSEPFLILHKVRGQPAFDIAEQIEMPDGEKEWIIPTSGHTAHPYLRWPLATFSETIGPLENINEASNCWWGWPSFPDHYHASRPEGLARKAPPKPNLRSVLAEIGLSVTPKIKIRPIR
jgi:hypothetical protein